MRQQTLTPNHIKVIEGYKNLLSEFTANSVRNDVNAVLANGQSMLIFSIINLPPFSSTDLLKNGANPNLHGKGLGLTSALTWALMLGEQGIAKTIIDDIRTNINYTDRNGYSELMHLVFAAAASTVPKTNPEDTQGQKTKFQAVQCNYLALAQSMKARGADPRHRSRSNRRTSADMARLFRLTELAALLEP